MAAIASAARRQLAACTPFDLAQLAGGAAGIARRLRLQLKAAGAAQQQQPQRQQAPSGTAARPRAAAGWLTALRPVAVTNAGGAAVGGSSGPWDATGGGGGGEASSNSDAGDSGGTDGGGGSELELALAGLLLDHHSAACRLLPLFTPQQRRALSAAYDLGGLQVPPQLRQAG